MRWKPEEYGTDRRQRGAFTLIELCVVVATIVVLAVLLLPALGGTRPDTRVLQAQNNLRQLTAAWILYADEYTGKLVPNGSAFDQPTSLADLTNPLYQPGGARAQWCPGSMRNVITVSNTAFIKLGLLYPYVKSVGVYKNPSDRSKFPNASYGYPRCRSVSMNCWLGPLPGHSWNEAGGYYAGTNALEVFRKFSSIDIPGGASRLFVFITENPYSIDDGFFVCDPNQASWVNLPASYHKGGGCISYADGHVGTRIWHDRNLLGSVVHGSMDPLADDLPWLQQRSTILDSGN